MWRASADRPDREASGRCFQKETVNSEFRNCVAAIEGTGYGETIMETGKYDLSTAGSDGERRGCRWQYQYYHSCMDRTICTNPAMAYISVRPERYSYEMIRSSGEFVINLTTKDLVHATDYCGVKSGRDVDKWKETRLTRGKAEKLRYAPTIVESPVNIECKVTEVKELGSHHMFLATVEAVQVDGTYMSAGGKFELNQAELLAYSHGSYLETGRELGTFGYSIRKKNKSKAQNPSKKNKKKAQNPSKKSENRTQRARKDR